MFDLVDPTALGQGYGISIATGDTTNGVVGYDFCGNACVSSCGTTKENPSSTEIYEFKTYRVSVSAKAPAGIGLDGGDCETSFELLKKLASEKLNYSLPNIVAKEFEFSNLTPPNPSLTGLALDLSASSPVNVAVGLGTLLEARRGFGTLWVSYSVLALLHAEGLVSYRNGVPYVLENIPVITGIAGLDKTGASIVGAHYMYISSQPSVVVNFFDYYRTWEDSFNYSTNEIFVQPEVNVRSWFPTCDVYGVLVSTSKGVC